MTDEQMARELGCKIVEEWGGKGVLADLIDIVERQGAALLASRALEEREKLAAWMMEHSFATGHGDSLEDLLAELAWQVKEIRGRALEEAKWWHEMTAAHPGHVCTETSKANSAECARVANLEQAAERERPWAL